MDRDWDRFKDQYGEPDDAASLNAATGTIAVANLFDNGSTPGSISICTLSGGCTANLTSPGINRVGGIVMAKNGDCWVSATNLTAATLTYFKGCSGTGQSTTAFKDIDYGALDIDAGGNLVSLDDLGGGFGQVWVYSGCKPACTVVGGPFALHGGAVGGSLNANSTRLVTADFQFPQVDVYRYSPTAITYMYSFSNGLSPGADMVGAAYDPRSKQ